jgi:uncharacterized protein YjiS (DUF1127 family)
MTIHVLHPARRTPSGWLAALRHAAMLADLDPHLLADIGYVRHPEAHRPLLFI